MKKALFLAVLCICTVSVWADDGFDGIIFMPEEKEPFRFKNRMIELGHKANVGFANDFLTFGEIFRDTVVIDMNSLQDGLRLNMDAIVSPFFFNFNRNDLWGFGIFVNTEAYGNMMISGKMLTISEAENDKLGLGAAVFAEVGGQAFFYIKKFKVKIKTSLFYPLLYTEPDISYTFKSNTETFEVNIKYDMLIYTAIPMEGLLEGNGGGGLTAQPGFDFGGSVEYPLFPFLDLGAEITHFPLVPAALNDYMHITGSFGIEETDDIFKLVDNIDDLFSTDSGDTSYGTGKKTILRPFKLLTYAEYRPFNNRLLSVIPSLGFAINPLYIKPFSMEGGIKARTDIANIFIATLGINYEDRLWKNSVDIALNLRAFELDLGLALQSQKLGTSWKGSGLGASVGIKFGW
ncbi:hypothetical protein AGMMS50293_01730 [Spirochaetia bacterium]|nr:hypothetical protein AGMMS50293_01730 [Spirochaetia bacterium]